jgi:hypothetical protein
MSSRLVCLFLAAALFVGCASGPQVVVDPRSITSEAHYRKDMSECQAIAQSYDRSTATGVNTVAGAAVGGTAVAGIATAVAGAIFWPAIPFIAAGAVAGGAAGGGMTKSGETASREKILADCLTDRGYKAYSPR